MSLLNTYKVEARALYPNRLDEKEWRFTNYGMVTAAQSMTNSAMSLVNDDIKKKAMDSEGRAMKIPVYTIGDAVSVSNVRSCNIGSFENTTELLSLTWVTLSVDVSMWKAQYQINEMTYLQDFAKKMLKAEHALAGAVETLIYTKLDTDKSGVYNSPLVSTDYTVTGNTLMVPRAKQEYFFNDIGTIMKGDDLNYSTYNVIANTSLESDVRHYANQGSGNDENLAYQFGNYNFSLSNSLTVPSGSRSSGFIIDDGSFAMLTRINADAMMGNSTTDGVEWETTNLDILGVEAGVMYKSTCDDLSGNTGLEHLKATHVENWQISLDVALLTPYNSDPVNVPGSIKKFEFLNA